MIKYNEIIYNRFLKQVEEHPCKTAIICNGITYTYEELLNLITKLHEELISCVDVTDQNVCIHMKRSPRMLAAIFAVLHAGGAYFLLDSNTPKIREQMYRDVVNPICTMEDDKIVVNNEHVINKSNIKDIAYIIFTSGTSGVPKGVCISNKSLDAAILSIPTACGFKADDMILAASNVSFDLFVLETTISLCIGITVVLADDQEFNNPRQLLNCVYKNKVTLLQMVPSKLKMVVNCDYTYDKLVSIREYILGGEAPNKKEVDFIRKHSNALIYNLYGLVEDTIYSTADDITHTDIYNINAPLKGHEIYLLNDKLQEPKVNEIGEIYLGGSGLYVDMLNCRDKDKRIIYIDNKRLYRTHDLAKKLEDNKFIYIGRSDNQIKIRGNRINPEEIELVANKLDSVICSIVKCFKNEKEVEILCMFYTGEEPIEIKDAIKEHLKRYLPIYMIPTYYFKIDKFDFLSSGKIDRNSDKLIEVYEKRGKNE